MFWVDVSVTQLENSEVVSLETPGSVTRNKVVNSSILSLKPPCFTCWETAVVSFSAVFTPVSLIGLVMLKWTLFVLTQRCLGFDHLSVGVSVTGDQVRDDRVFRKLDDGVGVVGGHTDVSKEGVQEMRELNTKTWRVQMLGDAWWRMHDAYLHSLESARQEAQDPVTQGSVCRAQPPPPPSPPTSGWYTGLHLIKTLLRRAVETQVCNM